MQFEFGWFSGQHMFYGGYPYVECSNKGQFTLARLIYQHPNNIRICKTLSLYLLYFGKHALIFLILKIEYYK
jgi:hypothetical protein